MENFLADPMVQEIGTWIVLGLVVGVIAKVLMPGDDPGGLIGTILIGIAGAFIGNFLGSFFGIATFTGINLPSIALAIGGALVLLLVFKLFRRRR